MTNSLLAALTDMGSREAHARDQVEASSITVPEDEDAGIVSIASNEGMFKPTLQRGSGSDI